MRPQPHFDFIIFLEHLWCHGLSYYRWDSNLAFFQRRNNINVIKSKYIWHFFFENNIYDIFILCFVKLYYILPYVFLAEYKIQFYKSHDIKIVTSYVKLQIIIKLDLWQFHYVISRSECVYCEHCTLLKY